MYPLFRNYWNHALSKIVFFNQTMTFINRASACQWVQKYFQNYVIYLSSIRGKIYITN